MVKMYIQLLLKSLHLLLECLHNHLMSLLLQFQFNAMGRMSCNWDHLFEKRVLKSLKQLICDVVSQKPKSTSSNTPDWSQWATPLWLGWIYHQNMAGVCLPELQPWSVCQCGIGIHSPWSISPGALSYHLEALTQSSLLWSVWYTMTKSTCPHLFISSLFLLFISWSLYHTYTYIYHHLAYAHLSLFYIHWLRWATPMYDIITLADCTT